MTRSSGSAPRRWGSRSGVRALVLGCVLASAPQLANAAPTSAARAVQNALDTLQLADAKQRLENLRTTGASAETTYLQGMLDFYEGRYKQALQEVDQALANAHDEEDRARYRRMRDLLASTLEATQGLATEASPDGRYQVRFTAGRDDVVVPYAMDVLKAADEILTQRLGHRVPGPVRLEIYPSASTLAMVSPLTVEQIETTGTIALSKWNRLMVTSPRALVRGYPWADTVTHELVHMVLSQVTAEQAPVWLQEGTAKMLERSWRGPEGVMRLDPSAEGLLAKAKADDELLTFDQMHPSIAMLPSQDAAALAFAEVATFMERYVAAHGQEALRTALKRIGAGEDAREALAEAAGARFAELERSWRNALPSKVASDAPRHLPMRLRHGSSTDESMDVATESARRFLRLGDMLWDRGRVLAATLEYEKGADVAPDDPILGARLSRAALSAGQPQRALRAVERLADRYPDHAPSQAMLGAAHLALGNRELAARALREAIYINPFDPQPHCDLAKAEKSAEARNREAQACRALGATP